MNANAKHPQFRPPPNRWLIVRRLDLKTASPADSGLPEFQSFIIESDRLHNINDIDETFKTELGQSVDLEVDVAPFINGAADPTSDEAVDGQAEVFIGMKLPAETWTEDPHRSFVNDNPKGKYLRMNVMNSSNPLFPDYQCCNSNVFSLIDDFAYRKTDPTKTPSTSIEYLEHADASYYLLGWHSEVLDDPFTTDMTIKNLLVPSRTTRLQDCMMDIKGAGTSNKQGSGEPEVNAWKALKEQSHAICHGAMYDVTYSTTVKPKTNLADQAAKILKTASPIAVGGTVLDSLLAIFRGRHDTEDDQSLNILEDDILKLQTLLISQEEDFDSQQAASDLMYAQNFSHSEGGIIWHFSADNRNPDMAPIKPTAPPDPTSNTSSGSNGAGIPKTGGAPQPAPTLDAPAIPAFQTEILKLLNDYQLTYDAAMRQADLLRFNLFCEWWKVVSDPLQAYQPDLTTPTATLEALVTPKTGFLDMLSVGMGKLLAAVPNQKAAADRFYCQKDPTLTFGGLKSAWPADFLDTLQARIDQQIIEKKRVDKEITDRQILSPDATTSESEAGWDGYDGYTGTLVPKLPTQLQDTARKLLLEFFLLRPQDNLSTPPDKPSTTPDKPSTPPETKPFEPQYHDLDPNTGTFRDSWNDTQPWFPLFVEWEAVYYHIPFTKWHLEERTRTSDKARVVMYGVDEDISAISKITEDVRTLSGRSLILPQPGYSLKSSVQQIYKTTDPKVLAAANVVEQLPDLMKSIDALQFMSCPISGITDHLLTRVQGIHVKPNYRSQGENVVPISMAVSVAGGAGFKVKHLQLMDGETTLTPYANLLNFENSGFCPFKPVTHGQMSFTKLNIVDKFGQAISAIDPSPQPQNQLPPPIFPYVSDLFSCGGLNDVDPTADDNHPNCISREKDPGSCRYIQLSPRINQDARLNADFVTRDSTILGGWRPVTEWENPIWGWLVVNYANYGLQFFLADGTFYRELRLGGPQGVDAEPKWLPFSPPTAAEASQSAVVQLDFLIAKMLGDKEFLQGFFEMINDSMENSIHPPSSYADQLPAAIGKPLCLVNAGWSLELATASYRPQATLRDQSLDPPPLEDSKSEYHFHVKIGDKERVFDGLVGYFNASPPAAAVAGAPQNTPSSDLDLRQLYTYFLDPKSKVVGHRVQIDSTNFPDFHPYYIDPSGHWSDPSWPSTFASMRYSHMKVLGMLVDPFIPVHAYSSILPNSTLQLPPWTIQDAMKRMTAFFHFGPLVFTSDIPRVFTKALPSDYLIADKDSYLDPGATVDLPVPSVTDFVWLSPYDVQGETKFSAFAVGTSDNRPKFEPGPYTALEGFLQMTKPIVHA